MDALLRIWRTRPLAFFLAVAGALTLVRIAALPLAEAGLGPDEAQYWVWSRNPAFGYFSKPPLIAWLIFASTSLFGDQAWAIRLFAPLCHFGAAAFLFALARRLYGEAAGFWTGLGWLTLPGVALSATLMTTDAPLLFFWSAGLYFFFCVLSRRAERKNALGHALALGAAIGLGLLAKYAMVYFLIGLGLALALSRETRQKFRLADGAITVAVAALFLAPNLVWNAEHGFQTIAHTARLAHWSKDLFHVGELFKFLGAQFGVFGPAPMALFIWGLVTLNKRLAASGPERSMHRSTDLALLAFALPPLAIVSGQAFIARAYDNWAVTAYPAALALVTAWALRAKIGAALRWSVGAHFFLAVYFLVAFSNFWLIDKAGLASVINNLRAWDIQSADIGRKADGYDAILVRNRNVMALLLYYRREDEREDKRDGPPIVAWNADKTIDNHFEAFMAYDPAAAPRALFVSKDPDPWAVVYDFDFVELVDVSTVTLPDGPRTLYLYEVSGYGENGD